MKLGGRPERHLELFSDDRPVVVRWSAVALTSTGTEVASGTVGGQIWSLWSVKGQSGADGVENGGLVLDGRAYGLCPGYPNPAELQLIDAGQYGVVAGVVGYPGRAKVALSESIAGTFDAGQALPSPTVQVVDGVSFFIGVLPKSACDYSSLELDTTSPASRLSTTSASVGAWPATGPDHREPGRLAATPGTFQSNF